MVDAMRAMLDELMGKERDVPADKRSNQHLTFNSKEVCKYALCGLCPYGLFKNTKSDLGACKYEMHEEQIGWESIQEDWDKLTEKEKDKHGYERELLTLLEQLVRDMDRKIERAKERAEKEKGARPLMPDDKIRLDALKKRQKDAMESSAMMAEQGNVDGSMAAATAAEDLQKQYDALYKELTANDRFMTVCEVCGVFINSTDNEQRRQDHLAGKQYQGWKAIREKLVQLQEKYAARAAEDGEIQAQEEASLRGQPSMDRSRSRERSSRSRERSRERDGYRPRSRGDERYRDERHRDSRYRDDRHSRDDRHRDDYRRRDHDRYDRRRY